MAFEKGQSGNPAGREKGSKNKLTVKISHFIDVLLDCYTDDDIKAMGAKLKDDKALMLGFLAKIAPRQLRVEHEGEIKHTVDNTSEIMKRFYVEEKKEKDVVNSGQKADTN